MRYGGSKLKKLEKKLPFLNGINYKYKSLPVQKTI